VAEAAPPLAPHLFGCGQSGAHRPFGGTLSCGSTSLLPTG